MKRITVYSQNACASCVMVKKWLAMKKITYNEVNLDEHPESREYVMKLSGAATVPIVVIEDDTTDQKIISVGYKPAQLATAVA